MEKLIKFYDDLTNSEKEIFDYIFNHQDEVKNMKIMDLAKKILVSKTLIINMTQKLGFSGYTDFKYYLKSGNIPKIKKDEYESIQSNLKDIGINISIQVLELSSFLQFSANGQHDMLIGLWYVSTGDADYGLFPLLQRSCFGGAGNRAFYKNPKVDDLLLRARNSNDQEERKALYREAQIIAQEEVPYYITAFKEQNVGLQKYVENFKQRPAGHHRLYGVKFKENADK